MSRISCGLLMYRRRDRGIEVFLVHPGGPLWRRKDEGAWTIPKGEPDPGEPPLDAAIREFQEETSFVPNGPYEALEPVRQKGGKVVHAWAFPGDCDPGRLVSSTFDLEWPPGSGRYQSCPEVDRGAFFDLPTARRKINPGQRPLIDQLEQRLAAAGSRR